MARFYGHIKDVPDPRDWKIGKLIGTFDPPPSCLAMRAHVDYVIDQQRASGCVGASGVAAVYHRALMAGIVLPHLSWLAAYVYARSMGGETPLQDIGSRPRDLWDALRANGVVAESRWSYVPPTEASAGNVNDLVPWDVAAAGFDACVTGYYAIPETGESRILAIKQAIAAGYPVQWAGPVDQAFEDYTGGVYPGVTGAVVGAHAQVLIGYDETGNFLDLNSWGSGWGEGGMAWIAPEWIGDPNVGDLYAVTVAPGGAR